MSKPISFLFTKEPAYFPKLYYHGSRNSNPLPDQPESPVIKVIPLSLTLVEPENDEYSNVVFGRSITNRFINKTGLMKMFNQLWLWGCYFRSRVEY